MKRTFPILLLIFAFASCSLPSYVFDQSSQETGVDFTKGTWLLNKIEAPSDMTTELTTLAMRDFSKNVGSRLSYLPTTPGLLIGQKSIGMNPDRTTLSNIKLGTKYDYFINIKAAQLKSEFAAIDLTPGRLNQGGENVNDVVIEIYDLNLLTTIYSQRVVASVGRQKDNSDVHFSKPSSSLILGAYRRAIKHLNNKSIH